MKKFKFNKTEFGEVLSRDDLKFIYGGGSGSSGQSGSKKYPKIEACRGKSYLDDCSFVSDSGQTLTGCCQYNALALRTTLYCSDLKVAPYTSCAQIKNSSRH